MFEINTEVHRRPGFKILLKNMFLFFLKIQSNFLLGGYDNTYF